MSAEQPRHTGPTSPLRLLSASLAPRTKLQIDLGPTLVLLSPSPGQLRSERPRCILSLSCHHFKQDSPMDPWTHGIKVIPHIISPCSIGPSHRKGAIRDA